MYRLIEYLIIVSSGLFDSRYYLNRYPDVKKAIVNPLWHFINNGWREERNPSDSFDTHFYVESNPDVRQANINPLLHYIRFGLSEGRLPVPVTYKALPYSRDKNGILIANPNGHVIDRDSNMWLDKNTLEMISDLQPGMSSIDKKDKHKWE